MTCLEARIFSYEILFTGNTMTNPNFSNSSKPTEKHCSFNVALKPVIDLWLKILMIVNIYTEKLAFYRLQRAAAFKASLFTRWYEL